MSKRILRDDQDRLESCEFHLLALWEATQKASLQPARHKQISAELRVLVCRHGRNKPLLLDIMKQYGVEGRANPKGHRILMLGWKENQEYIDAYHLLENKPEDPDELIEELHTVMPPAPPIMFEDYLDQGLAVGNENGEYSYKQLILALSQQMGTGHEDPSLEQLLYEVSKPRSSGEPLFLRPLLTIANNVLSLGSFLFMWMVKSKSYEPKYLAVDFFEEHWKVEFTQ